MGTIVSYLKGALLLLSNCKKISMDAMGLLNGRFCSTVCDNFTYFMKNVYIIHNQKLKEINAMQFLSLVDSK